MSQLLKFARAKDDQDFIWRIGAAMMVHAQYIDLVGNLASDSRALVDWVFANPMEADDVMVRYVSTNPEIAASVTTELGGVDTSGVPDEAIQYTVDAKWDAVAAKRFGAAA